MLMQTMSNSHTRHSGATPELIDRRAASGPIPAIHQSGHVNMQIHLPSAYVWLCTWVSHAINLGAPGVPPRAWEVNRKPTHQLRSSSLSTATIICKIPLSVCFTFLFLHLQIFPDVLNVSNSSVYVPFIIVTVVDVVGWVFPLELHWTAMLSNIMALNLSLQPEKSWN